jgi:hypothetical protein
MAFSILSLDGGGTWALLEVMALADLYPGESGHQILSHFDLAVANSGGSIVLGGLVLDMSPDQILSFFEDQTKREAIFYRKPFIEEFFAKLPIFPRYVAAQKRVGLGTAFGPAGNTLLKDWPAAPGWPNGPSGEPVRILVVAFDYDRQREDFLRSYSVSSTKAEPEAVAIVDAVHASTNAPVTFFDAPAMVSPKRYWDGAMGGYNNPLMAAVVDAIALGAVPSQIAALSIGTGTVRLAPPDLVVHSTSPDLTATPPNPDPIGDAARAAGCITDDPPDAATFTAHVVTGNDPSRPGRVVRMSPVVQPVRDITNNWTYPPGLAPDLFKALASLSMDAVQAADVTNIKSLGTAWLGDGVPNQPIRMRDDLSCALGHPNYSAAKAHWQGLGPGPQNPPAVPF